MYFVLRYDEGEFQAVKMLDRPEIPGYENIAFDNGTKLNQQIPGIEFRIRPDQRGELLDILPAGLPGRKQNSGKKDIPAGETDHPGYCGRRYKNKTGCGRTKRS